MRCETEHLILLHGANLLSAGCRIKLHKLKQLVQTPTLFFHGYYYYYFLKQVFLNGSQSLLRVQKVDKDWIYSRQSNVVEIQFSTWSKGWILGGFLPFRERKQTVDHEAHCSDSQSHCVITQSRRNYRKRCSAWRGGGHQNTKDESRLVKQQQENNVSMATYCTTSFIIVCFFFCFFTDYYQQFRFLQNETLLMTVSHVTSESAQTKGLTRTEIRVVLHLIDSFKDYLKGRVFFATCKQIKQQAI